MCVVCVICVVCVLYVWCVMCVLCVCHFCETHNLENIVIGPTCFKNPLHPTSIDLMLTNIIRGFQNSVNIESGLSVHHMMTISVMKSFFPKQTPSLIRYRCYRKFNSKNFGKELFENLEKLNEDARYEDFEAKFMTTLNKHAPMKKKFVRANNAPFITKKLSKAIMNRSRFRNKYLKNPNVENKAKYNKQRNYCVNLLRREKRAIMIALT